MTTMLPSGVTFVGDVRDARPVSFGRRTARGTHRADATSSPYSARGPLARQVTRLLGIGAQQSFTAGTLAAQERALRSRSGAALGQAWIAARILPTPNGYFR